MDTAQNLIAQSFEQVGPATGGAPTSSNGRVQILQFNRAIWRNSEGEAVSGRYQLNTPGEVIAALYPYLFSLAGLILFVMLVWGAFEIMMGANDSKSVDSGKKRITAAVIGFLLLFASYWIGQIIQYIFGLSFGLAGA